MARFKEPNCIGIDPDDTVCGVRMRLMGERDPRGANGRPGVFVFNCPRCGAVRVLDKLLIDRYVERV